MSDGKFGVKIGIEGEKEFKSALNDINQSFKILGSEMALATSQFDKNDKSVQAAAARNAVLSKEIDTQKEKVTTLKSALDNASASFGESDKRTQSWQIQLNKAKAELNNMERELDQNNKALETDAKEFDDTGKEAEQFGKELELSAKDADEAGGKFEKVGEVVKGIGVAIGAAMAAIGAAAVAAGKALFDMASDTAAAGDRVDKMSQKLGLSNEGFQEWDYILSQNGASIDSLGAGMKTLQKTMDGLTEDGDKSSEAFAKIGISFDEIKDKSPEEAFGMTVKALQDMPPGAEKTAAALKLLGKQGMELMPLLNQTADDTEGLRQRAHDLGMVMSDDAANASVVFGDTLDDLKGTIAGVRNTIGAEFLPGLTEITEGLIGLITGNEDAAESIKSGAESIVASISEVLPRVLDTFTLIVSSIAAVAPDIINALIQGISDNLPGLISAGVTIVMAVVDSLTQALPQLTQGALQLVLALAEGIVSNLPSLVEAATQVIATLVQGIGEALPQLIPAVVEAVTTIVQGLIDNLPMLLDAALQLITGLAQGLLDALPVLIDALPGVITAIIDFVIGAIPQIIDAGIQLLVSLVEALPEIIEAIVAAIPEIIDGIITAVLDAIPLIIEAGIKLLVALIQNLPTIIITIVEAIPKIIISIIDALIGNIDKIIMAGVQLFVALIENLPTIIVEIVKAIPQIITGLVNAIISFVPKLAETGLNLIKGLWQGISDAAAWLWEKISGFFGAIVDKIKGFFGIHSPSTLFAGLGFNMGEGIGVGFEKAMDKVGEDMKNAVPKTFDAPDLDIGANIHAAVSGVSGVDGVSAVDMIGAVGGVGAVAVVSDLGAKMDGIIAVMSEMFPALLEALNVKVVLEDGTLVGRLAPEIDRNLALLRRRGTALE